MRIFSTILLSLIIIQASAQKIGISEVKKAATLLIQERFPDKINYSVSDIIAMESNEDTTSWLVRLYPYGFVLLSSDKNIHPVLAYSFYSTTGENDYNPGFFAFVKTKNSEIEVAKKQKIYNPVAVTEWNRMLTGVKTPVKSEVLPMLKTQWNQGVYYNQYCPADPAGPDNKCVTGCVATALGQLMNYFRWPLQGSGQYTSEDTVYGTLSVNYTAARYNYNEMATMLNRQNDESAKLVYNIGVSVDMHYGPDGSGMTNHKAAHTMKTFFQYGDSATYAFRDEVTWDWDSMLISYITRGIPLYYAGWADTALVSGHAFILDGHQDSTYFHFNWGWGGSYDGYFYIDNLMPGGADFTLKHEAVINIMPSGGYPYFCHGTDTLTSLDGTIDDGSGPLYNYQPEADCYWLIQPDDSVKSITLEFLKLATESGNDVVTIYNGASTSSGIYGTYSGTTLPSQITLNKKAVLVHFSSDAQNESAGFLLRYSASTYTYCTSVIVNMTGESGVITDKSGSFDYHNSSFCRWKVQPVSQLPILFEFTELDLSNEDNVKITKLDGTVLQTYTGNTLPDVYLMNEPAAIVLFSSNSTFHADGFELHYRTSPVGINENKNNLTFYPNPAEGFIEVESTKEGLIDIYDAYGRLVRNNILLATGKSQIDLSFLSPGMYQLVFVNQTQRISKTLILNR